MAEEPEFLSPQQFARLAGVHVTTVHNWIKKGAIPRVKIGGRGKSTILIPRNALSPVFENEHQNGENKP